MDFFSFSYILQFFLLVHIVRGKKTAPEKSKFPRKIIVAAINYESLFEYPNETNGKPSGMDGKLLEALSGTLHFHYKLVPPFDGEWGRMLQDGNWSGIIGMVQRGEVDIGISTLGITKSRLQVVDFTQPYMDMDRTFASYPPKLLPRAYAYIYPFDPITWGISFFMLLSMPLLMLRLSNRKYSYTDGLFRVFANLLGKSEIESVNKENRVFTSLWLSGSMILSYCYVAALPSFLLIPLKEPSIQDFSELATAVSISGYVAYADKGSTHVEEMYRAGREDLILIADAIEENQWYRNVALHTDQEFLREKMVKFGGRLFLLLEPTTTKFVSKSGYSLAYFGIAVNKKFCCKRQLDDKITRALQGGLYQKYISDEVYKSGFSYWKKYKEEANDFIISFSDTKGAVFILLSGHAVASFVLVLEVLVARKFHK